MWTKTISDLHAELQWIRPRSTLSRERLQAAIQAKWGRYERVRWGEFRPYFLTGKGRKPFCDAASNERYERLCVLRGLTYPNV